MQHSLSMPVSSPVHSHLQHTGAPSSGTQKSQRNSSPKTGWKQTSGQKHSMLVGVAIAKRDRLDSTRRYSKEGVP